MLTWEKLNVLWNIQKNYAQNDTTKIIQVLLSAYFGDFFPLLLLEAQVLQLFHSTGRQSSLLASLLTVSEHTAKRTRSFKSILY